MSSPIKHMTIVEYFRDGRPWETHHINNPSWPDVESAIRKMDNYCFPIVQLCCADLIENETCFDDEESFNVVGGVGKLALFHYMGDWNFERSNGSSEEFRLWDSDQGYFCEEKNIIYDIEHVLRIVNAFYRTGSYEGLNSIA